MPRLQNKSALITGASQGLGLELAIAFAREGAKQLAIVARDENKLQHRHAERIRATINVARRVVFVCHKHHHIESH